MAKRLTQLASIMRGYAVQADTVRAFTDRAMAVRLTAELNQPGTGVQADMEMHRVTHAKGCKDAMTVAVYTVHVKVAPTRPAPLVDTSTVYEYPEGVFECLACGKRLTRAQAAAGRCPNRCKGV